MQRAVFASVADLERARGKRIGESAWFPITQELVDAFADVINDHQWIHVDSERARRESPLGTTIAHGFLTLSLLSTLIAECVSMQNVRYGLNYGFERVRFVSPVPVGSEIRGAFSLEELRPIEGGAQISWRAEVEVRGSSKPALSALWLTRTIFKHGTRG